MANEKKTTLLDELAEFAKTVHDTLAAVHIDSNDNGNLYNLLNKLEKSYGEYQKKKQEEEKKKAEEEKKKAEEEKKKGKGQMSNGSFPSADEIGDFLKSDTGKQILNSDLVKGVMNSGLVQGVLNSDLARSFLEAEPVKDFLKQYSSVIKDNAALIKKFVPKQTADKLFAMTVTSDDIVEGLKTPETMNKNLQQVINDRGPVTIDKIKANPEGYRATYERAKQISMSAPDTSKLSPDQKAYYANANNIMAGFGSLLSEASPELEKSISEDFKVNMLKNKEFRDAVVTNSARNLLTNNVTAESYAKMDPASRALADKDVQRVLYGAAANNMLAQKGQKVARGSIANPEDIKKLLDNNKDIQALTDRSFEAFKKDPGKYLDFIKKPMAVQKAASAASQAQHAQMINESPIENFDENLRTDMLKSSAFRAEKVNEAQLHLKSVMETTGSRSSSDLRQLPKDVRVQVDKDIKTILYGHTAEAALGSKRQFSLSDPESVRNFANNQNLNGFIDAQANQFINNDKANIQALLNNEMMRKLEQKNLSANKNLVDDAFKDVDFSKKSQPEAFDSKLKTDMLKSRGYRADKVAEAQKNLKSTLGKIEGPLSADNLNKLSPEVKQSIERDIKTIAFGHASEASLAANGKANFKSTEAAKQFSETNGLNWVVKSSLEDFYKNPSENIKTLLDNKQLQKLSREKMADFKGECANSLRNDTAVRTFTVNPGGQNPVVPDSTVASGIDNAAQKSPVINENPLENLDSNLKTDMLKSSAFRSEKIHEAQMHLKAVMEEHGDFSKDNIDKLPKSVREAVDKDIKTIAYGHIAEGALQKNGLSRLSDDSVINKLANSRTMDGLVNGTLENFYKDPSSHINTVLDNTKMQNQVSHVKMELGELAKKDVFDDKLKNDMLGDKSYRSWKMMEAENNIKNIAGNEPMTRERFNSLPKADQEAFDANMKTIIFGHVAESALNMGGKSEIKDNGIASRIINNENVNTIVNKSSEGFFEAPGDNVKTLLDSKKMQNLSNNELSKVSGDFKEIFSPILDMSKKIGQGNVLS